MCLSLICFSLSLVGAFWLSWISLSFSFVSFSFTPFAFVISVTFLLQLPIPYSPSLSYPPFCFCPHRMLQPVPKQEGRTVVVVNSPRTPIGPVPVRPSPGPEFSAQPTPGPTPPMLPAPLMVSASPVGPPLIPASRPPGPVLLPPLQPNSGPLPQGELQGGQCAGGYLRQIVIMPVQIGEEVMKLE